MKCLALALAIIFSMPSFSTEIAPFSTNCVGADVALESIEELSHLLDQWDIQYEIFQKENSEQYRVLALSWNGRITILNGKAVLKLDKKLENMMKSEALKELGITFKTTSIQECSQHWSSIF